jgi:hypothetical protein
LIKNSSWQEISYVYISEIFGFSIGFGMSFGFGFGLVQAFGYSQNLIIT